MYTINGRWENAIFNKNRNRWFLSAKTSLISFKGCLRADVVIPTMNRFLEVEPISCFEVMSHIKLIIQNFFP